MIAVDDDRNNDMCPICRTDRYLSPNMTFLINPECYHKICESCVDRIFSLGPSKCPYPGCGKILRKNKFKKQVFDDLKVEREIDIRKRVSGIYNSTEEDFDTPEAYDDYLTQVEDIIFNLTTGHNVDETEAALVKYEQDHKIDILEKQMRESKKSADLLKFQESSERLKQEKLRIQKQMEMEDLDFKRRQQQELLDKLSNSAASSEEVLKQQTQANLKRSQLRKRQLEQIQSQLDADFNDNNPLVAKKEVVKAPFTPFVGDRDPHREYTLMSGSDAYYDPFATDLAKNKEYLAGGWRLDNVFARVLDETFTGLGCIISAEKQSVKPGA
ncbi:RNA polymerase II transcription factor B subunit 3 [Diutina catenulata]